MIIQMSASDMNKRTANYLATYYQIDHTYILNHPAKDIASLKDTHCLIIDLDPNMVLNQDILPEQFAQTLVAYGLPASIQDIYLFAGELIPDHIPAVFAHHLARSFAELHQRKINIHIAAYLNTDITIVIPPENNRQWKIYGFNRIDLPQDTSPLMLEKIPNKRLVWQGEDILNWMNESQQTFKGTAYVWGEAS